MKKRFPRADIQRCISPVDAWVYLTKDRTNVDPPIIKGPVPKPNKNNKIDLAAHNRLLRDIGTVAAVEQGLVRVI